VDLGTKHLFGFLFFLFLFSKAHPQADTNNIADTSLALVDTVFLAPDTVVQEEIVYIEYLGAPEQYLSASIHPFLAFDTYSNRTHGTSYGIVASIGKTKNKLSVNVGTGFAYSSWGNHRPYSWHEPFLREEKYDQVLDSFGIVTNGDTVWQSITQPATRKVLDSTKNNTIISEKIHFASISTPISIGYKIGSGYLFGIASLTAEPGLIISSKSHFANYQDTPKKKLTDTELHASFCNFYAQLSVNYLLTPTILVSATTGIKHTFIPISNSIKQKGYVCSIAFTYIINGYGQDNEN